MSINNKIATIFGGTGFIGAQIVRELAQRGITVKVATRVPERAYFLRPCGTVGQIVPFACNYSDPESIQAAIKDADYVINCIGVLYEKGKRRTFQRAHVDLAERIAEACKTAGVKRFVHISALVDAASKSAYAQSKLAGEQAVLKAFKAATILRPSVVFGEGDGFFNLFARLAQIFPVLPLIGGGHTRFQPIFVGDVADAVMAALELPLVGDQNPQGKIYELGGPEIVNFKEIYARLFKYTGLKRPLVKLPFMIAKIEAWFLSLLPNPLLTPDQVESLKTDCIVSKNAFTLADLKIQPRSMDLILPTYLSLYKPGGRFADIRSEGKAV